MIQANRGERHYTNSEIDILNYAYNTARTIPAFNEDGSLYYYKKSYVHPKAGQRLDLGFNDHKIKCQFIKIPIHLQQDGELSG